MEQNKKTADLILNWYKDNGRQFLWRKKTKNPYDIMVAEILLQRTTAKSVEKFYPQFIEKYPDLKTLELAKMKDLEEILSNLGLLYKAKIFKKIAQKLKESDYIISKNKEDLMDLYGIGDYISSAVLTFGFDINTPIVDSNIRRFASRFWNQTTDNLIKEKLIGITLKNMKEIYFGLLDICWYFCRAPKPQCGNCPLKSVCIFND